jgi:hypothetical protein
MANWALVENGTIVTVCDNLPRNWQNISGFYHLESDLQRLADLGWLPVTKQHQTYDPNWQMVMGEIHELQDGAVIETLILKDREPPVVAEREAFLRRLRNERNRQLAQTDWTMLEDAKDNLGEELYNKYKTYRQLLRNLPEKYIGESILDLESVAWPRHPNAAD